MAEITNSELCGRAVRSVAEWWRVDPNRVEWRDDGFDWWPGACRVNVTVLPAPADQHVNACRLTIRTNVLRDVPVNADTSTVLSRVARLAPTYGVAYSPLMLNAAAGSDAPTQVWLGGSAYVIPDTVWWLPHQLAMLSSLQIVDAEAFAEHWATPTGGAVDVSVKPGAEHPFPTAEVINWVKGHVCQPEAAESRWKGSGEFEACAEQFGCCDTSFGIGDPSGLTLETPIGVDSAQITLLTDHSHPAYGAGLLATLQVRMGDTPAQVREWAAICNLLESTSWTDVPQLGSWSVCEVDAETSRLLHSIFIPNAFYCEGLATNVALWQLGRARWVKSVLWPNLHDCTMAEVMEGRCGDVKAH